MKTVKELQRYFRKVLPTCQVTLDEISREVVVHTGVYETTPGGALAEMEEDDSGLPDEPERPEFGRYRD